MVATASMAAADGDVRDGLRNGDVGPSADVARGGGRAALSPALACPAAPNEPDVSLVLVRLVHGP